MAKTSTQQRGQKKKVCQFCESEADYIDYKNYPLLKPHLDYFGNIRKRFHTGVCLHHQKMLKTAVERARFMGMLAYRK